jgi:mycothiol synthase
VPEPPDPVVPEPYRLATTSTSDDDCAHMASLLNAAFGRTVHMAREHPTFVKRSTSFDHYMNLVAVAPDGSFAAHAGVTYGEHNRHGIFEPACTRPDHRRFGLARDLMLEGLRRPVARGAQSASADMGDQVASNALNASRGFTEAHHFHAWRRDW